MERASKPNRLLKSQASYLVSAPWATCSSRVHRTTPIWSWIFGGRGWLRKSFGRGSPADFVCSTKAPSLQSMLWFGLGAAAGDAFQFMGTAVAARGSGVAPEILGMSGSILRLPICKVFFMCGRQAYRPSWPGVAFCKTEQSKL